jgi:hypothetical protein
MPIEIATRFAPYSHMRETSLLVPSLHCETTYYLKIFHAEIQVIDLLEPHKILSKIALPISGPVSRFTVQQDLEKGCIVVFGFSKTGYFRYKLQQDESPLGFALHFEKGQLNEFASAPVDQIAHRDIPPIDRLCLGSHKAQDWESIYRRGEMKEILPLWHRLGQLVKAAPSNCPLLKECHEALKSNDKALIGHLLKTIFLAGFQGMMVPRTHDDDNQGLVNGPIVASGSPVCLLTEGSSLIRQLFVSESKGQISLLPHLLPEFHTGRLTQVQLPQGLLSIEWSKKAMRRALLLATKSTTVHFHFHQGEVSCRLNKESRYESGTPMHIVSGATYLFDNFQR